MIPYEPHPEVWSLVAGIGGAYWAAVRRQREATGSPVPRRRRASFVVGLLAMWAALDWPIDDLGDGSLLSVHMVQFLLLSVVAPAFLLRGCTPWLVEAALAGPRRLAVAQALRAPLFAWLIVSAILVGSHVPAVVDLYLTQDLVHLSMHAAWLASGVVLWWPVLVPQSVARPLPPAAQIGYLFMQSLAAIIPAAFLTFSARLVYPAYARLPKPAGIDAMADQQLAGVLMKIGGGLLLWIAIAVIFFRWARDEEQRTSPRSVEPLERGTPARAQPGGVEWARSTETG